jgi:integrase
VTDFHRHVADYLQLRRSLGFKPGFCARVLPQLASYLEASGAPVLTAQLAICWAGLPEGVQPIILAHRLGAARGLARYLQAIDPATEIPPAGIWPATAHRPTPYLWSPGDICRLLEAAHGLRPLLRALTYETLFGLLACSGLRLGEALSLRREDADLGTGVLTIREAKFDRSRLVPLHPSTTQALRTYAGRRDTLCRRPRPAVFFASSAGTAPSDRQVHHTFAQLTSALGLRNATIRPRIHDFRHSFAVRTLINWHRAGVDTGAHMAVLSNYLGHVRPASTYWYLTAAPELMELAAARLQTGPGVHR